MPKKLISEQQVINAATLLANSGKSLTLAAVRIHLGANGSDATIHKYLKKWKQECFKKGADQQHSFESYNNYIEEKRILEQTLNKKCIQNEHYVQELINTEKANIALKEENRQLQAAKQELQLRLIAADATNKALEQLTQEITNRLDVHGSKDFSNQQQIINDLREELKTLNATSLIALRDASTKGHEALMQERVNSINLQTKVDSLYKELIDLKKQLSDTVLKHQIQTQTLLRQVNEQQKIIQDHIGMEKLSELVGEEVMLHFNNKPGVAYGK